MAAPYSTPIPNTPQYQQAVLQAKTAYQNALARLNQQRQSTLRQYGYAGDINAETGVVGNVRIDPSNPYGHFQQANRSQAMRAEMAADESVERGLGGGGGLAAQAQRSLKHDFGREDAEIGTNLTDLLSGFQDQQTSAAFSRDAAQYEAELQATRDALMERLFNPADQTGVQLPGYGQDPITQGPATVPEVSPPPGMNPISTMRWAEENAPPPTGVQWGGQHFTTKAALGKWLRSHGTSFAAWAKKHPDAAARLK